MSIQTIPKSHVCPCVPPPACHDQTNPDHKRTIWLTPTYCLQIKRPQPDSVHKGQQGAGSRPNCFTTSGSIGDEATSNHVDLDRSGAFSRTRNQSHEISPTHEQPCSGYVPPHHTISWLHSTTKVSPLGTVSLGRWRMLYAAKILGSHARRPRTGMRNHWVGFLTSGEEQSRQGNSRIYS